ncbi:conserved hypothetical protein [Halomonas sp. A3H3]|nr:conserved hypothetical protein [Halomonas sp. 59]CAD5247396.1 conserved hypothetical protein [Halomonas sp. 113]CAD5252591.1 conserved hypothetical protein [Halomonas sp. 156]CAD5289524.1 conserved hypothetical protein [Halomonas sp. I3]CDG54479.1 conserved hypothetical protein [Halomonas sp. A3H3]VXB95123.1 conserved hypothetical protein [Halomonas titanicae]
MDVERVLEPERERDDAVDLALPPLLVLLLALLLLVLLALELAALLLELVLPPCSAALPLDEDALVALVLALPAWRNISSIIC